MSQPEPYLEQEQPTVAEQNFLDRFSLIFSTGFSEIKRKGAITRLYFEIKGLEKDKEKFVRALGNHAWEAHVEHSDFAGIIVNLKELQIDINRYETQFGEHDTQIKDIESSKSDLTEKFNLQLDQLEQEIVPHRQRIETINAEKEDNKIQIEELRSKQDQLSQQVRVHQQNIQQFDLDSSSSRVAEIELEKASIRNIFLEKCEIECKIPFLMSNIEKLKVALADETSHIARLENEKETAKRDFEHRMKDYNNQIHQLEDKKKQTAKQKEQLRREMEPYLFDLGRKMELLRLQEEMFPEVYEELDGVNNLIEMRRQQIVEAESLSRAMDRTAWTKFLVFSCGMIIIVLSLVLILLQ